MSTKSITIHKENESGEEEIIEVVLKSATKEDSIRRAELMIESKNQPNQLRQQAAFYLFPTCVTAVRSPESIRNISFDDFMTKIVEADVDTWATEAYELNPQWKLGMKALAEMSQEEEKKTMTSSPGSPTPTDQSKSTETSPSSKRSNSTRSKRRSSKEPNNS